MRSVQWEADVPHIVHKCVQIIRITNISWSLFQTLTLLKFMPISNFFMLFCDAIKLLLILVLQLSMSECFGKILTYKFKHLNTCFKSWDSWITSGIFKILAFLESSFLWLLKGRLWIALQAFSSWWIFY